MHLTVVRTYPKVEFSNKSRIQDIKDYLTQINQVE